MIGEMLWSSDALWINCGNGRILFCPGGDVIGVELSDRIVTDTHGNEVGWEWPTAGNERQFPRPKPGYHWQLVEARPPHNKRMLDHIQYTPVGEGLVYTIEKDDE
jgi:hypothetical protein